MPTTTDLLGLAIEKSPVEFAAAFDEIMQQKATDAIAAKRIELAQTIYGDSDEDGAEEFESDVEDDDTDEDEYLDVDDVDVDLEDLDLEDSDTDEDA